MARGVGLPPCSRGIGSGGPEQLTQSADISSNVQQIAVMSEVNHASVRDAAIMAEKLTVLAEGMQQQVAGLRL